MRKDLNLFKRVKALEVKLAIEARCFNPQKSLDELVSYGLEKLHLSLPKPVMGGWGIILVCCTKFKPLRRDLKIIVCQPYIKNN